MNIKSSGILRTERNKDDMFGFKKKTKDTQVVERKLDKLSTKGLILFIRTTWRDRYDGKVLLVDNNYTANLIDRVNRRYSGPDTIECELILSQKEEVFIKMDLNSKFARYYKGMIKKVAEDLAQYVQEDVEAQELNKKIKNPDFKIIRKSRHSGYLK